MWQNIRKATGYVLAAMLLVSLVTTLYAESARGSANVGAKSNGPKVNNQGPKKNNAPDNVRKGDNRDDAKSGKVDRKGDGNSGQGDDKKAGVRPPKHDPRSCPICKRHLPPKKEPPKRQPPQTSDKDKDNQGVRDRGQGEGRDGSGLGKGQGDENRKGNSLRKKWGADRREDVRDRKEDRRDNREDVRDRREDVNDRREDRRDRAEDRRDEKTDGGKWDKREDRRDKKEDVRDKREDNRDNREDVRDRREDRKDRREDKRDNKFPPKRKWGAGDNRDDNKSGKIDRPGDGNSGQGNDRKLPPKREGNDRPKIKPNPEGGSSSNTPEKRRGDNRDDSKSGKLDRPGDGNSGQGNDKDARLRPPHNPRTCPICNPKMRTEAKNRKPNTSKDNLGISGTVPQDKSNEGVRDGGKGEGRDSAGQGKGQGDTNKENKENKENKDKPKDKN